MNFLAHLYLSGDDDDLKIGNFIGDHVKGKAIFDLPDRVRKGVLLHRRIDFFTDTHPVVMQSKERLRPVYHKYSPVITDIFYDHFLAANWNDYSNISLKDYAQNFYKLTEKYDAVLPERTKKMLSFMISGNWFLKYTTTKGIGEILSGMSRRTTFTSGMETAYMELEKNYLLYENEFRIFFSDLEKFSREEINKIILSSNK